MTPETPITSATRRLSQQQIDGLRKLTPGQRIQVVQTVRVGTKKWQSTTAGVFRGINYLATGVTTERVPEDDIVVPMVHFTKDNGEMSSVAVDENSQISVI